MSKIEKDPKSCIPDEVLAALEGYYISTHGTNPLERKKLDSTKEQTNEPLQAKSEVADE